VRQCQTRVLGRTDQVGVFRIGFAHIQLVVLRLKMEPKRRCLCVPFAYGAAPGC
jgi:hypothetical protein